MEATLEDMEATVDTVLATGDTTASVRLRPSPTTATEGTEATVVVTEAMVDTATAEATTESVRLMPSLRLLPSPTTATRIWRLQELRRIWSWLQQGLLRQA